MALKVIGSGLGRTGTLSMKYALEQLGFGPCHHMAEVFRHPESVPLWVAAGNGKPDWDALARGFNAMVDYPGSRYWRELYAHYPDAKVLHTVRDPDTWFESTQATIFAPDGPLFVSPPGMQEFFSIIASDFGSKIGDRAFMTDFFRRHTERVIQTIPKERLLVYHVGEGWERLCAFLGVPVPQTPFPSENSRGVFAARSAQLRT